MGLSIINIGLIVITCLVSFAGFKNENLVSKFIFHPVSIRDNNEYWRFITHGFLHADFNHLLFNMLTLFFFGSNVEQGFEALFSNEYIYPLFYISALIVSSIPSYLKNKNNANYSALGASGAVSAVLFATILFDPWATIYLKMLIPIPAILYAVGYVIYSAYMSKKGGDGIGHDAHLYGALYGFLFPILFQPRIFSYFIEQIQHPRFLQ